MLFKHRFHPGIREGSITTTYRTWSSPRVKAGGTYRLGTSGAVVVEQIDEVALGSLTDGDARRSGFDSVDELVALLRTSAQKRLTRRSKVYRVTFRFEAQDDPRKALQRDASKAAISEVLERLARMDRLSRRGPWTGEVLALIAARPRTRAPDLAASLGRETRPFKADVRKLKALGLTISHNVGYELSPRGKAVLTKLKRKSRSR